MSDKRYYLAYGGGLGDVVYSYLHDPCAGMLRHLVEDEGATVRVYTQCHNDGVADVFKHHPYIHEHIAESWQLPSEAETERFKNPIDGHLPVSRHVKVRERLSIAPILYLTTEERQFIDELRNRGDYLIVLQPFAGLYERDAFNDVTLERLVRTILDRRPSAHVVIMGRNHGRSAGGGEAQRIERVGFTHPNVTDLIDRAGIRVCHTLTERADAFCGSHSNLIRSAWDAHVPSVCITGAPYVTDRFGPMDPRCTYGLTYPESRLMTYRYEYGGLPEFDTLDIEAVAGHLLSPVREAV